MSGTLKHNIEFNGQEECWKCGDWYFGKFSNCPHCGEHNMDKTPEYIARIDQLNEEYGDYELAL